MRRTLKPTVETGVDWVLRGAAHNLKPEPQTIDVHRLKVTEAQEKVEQALYDAIVTGVPELRIQTWKCSSLDRSGGGVEFVYPFGKREIQLGGGVSWSMGLPGVATYLFFSLGQEIPLSVRLYAVPPDVGASVSPYVSTRG